MSSSLSLGNLCRRCQTVSPPLHFTSHELVNIIQRHLFSLNVFPLFLPSFFIFLILNFFFLWVLSFAIGWWWHDALEQHHCSRGLFRSNTKHVPNYLMYTPPIDSPRYSPITRWLVVWFFFLNKKKNSTHYHSCILSLEFMPVIASKRDRWVIVVISTWQRY